MQRIVSVLTWLQGLESSVPWPASWPWGQAGHFSGTHGLTDEEMEGKEPADVPMVKVLHLSGLEVRVFLIGLLV